MSCLLVKSELMISNDTIWFHCQVKSNFFKAKKDAIVFFFCYPYFWRLVDVQFTDCVEILNQKMVLTNQLFAWPVEGVESRKFKKHGCHNAQPQNNKDTILLPKRMPKQWSYFLLFVIMEDKNKNGVK